MYECHLLTDSRYYLKPRSSVVRLVSCLPKSNKGLKDDYLITSGEWYDGLHCPTREGKPGGGTLGLGPFSSFSFPEAWEVAHWLHHSFLFLVFRSLLMMIS